VIHTVKLSNGKFLIVQEGGSSLSLACGSVDGVDGYIGKIDDNGVSVYTGNGDSLAEMLTDGLVDCNDDIEPALARAVEQETREFVDSDHDPIMFAIGAASMCWENPGGAGVFDSNRAADIGNQLRQHFADGIGDFATARRRVCSDMQKDVGLQKAYEANIAVVISDNSSISIPHSDRLAIKIMQLLFEIPEE